MLAVKEAQSEKKAIYALLMNKSRALINDHYLACMVASMSSADSAMPARLGLDQQEFENMLSLRFGRVSVPEHVPAQGSMDPQRLPERDDLINLMMMHRAGNDDSERWMAYIVSAGCMAGAHLWQDLGLWSRNDLSELMRDNFPSLAAKNDRDMKWKKFLYKQLCIQEGIYTCRSPSCEVCPDYSDCFGPED